jgi:co-chaperonin GroES (HSP10)
MTNRLFAVHHADVEASIFDGVALLPGRVVIRTDRERGLIRGIILPDWRDGDETQIHKGTVLRMGPPARSKWGHDVPPGFSVGDRVLFVWTALEKQWKLGQDVALLPQENVVAVLEPGPRDVQEAS